MHIFVWHKDTTLYIHVNIFIKQIYQTHDCLNLFNNGLDPSRENQEVGFQGGGWIGWEVCLEGS